MPTKKEAYFIRSLNTAMQGLSRHIERCKEFDQLKKERIKKSIEESVYTITSEIDSEMDISVDIDSARLAVMNDLQTSSMYESRISSYGNMTTEEPRRTTARHTSTSTPTSTINMQDLMASFMRNYPDFVRYVFFNLQERYVNITNLATVDIDEVGRMTWCTEFARHLSELRAHDQLINKGSIALHFSNGARIARYIIAESVQTFRSHTRPISDCRCYMCERQRLGATNAILLEILDDYYRRANGSTPADATPIQSNEPRHEPTISYYAAETREAPTETTPTRSRLPDEHFSEMFSRYYGQFRDYIHLNMQRRMLGIDGVLVQTIELMTHSSITEFNHWCSRQFTDIGRIVGQQDLHRYFHTSNKITRYLINEAISCCTSHRPFGTAEAIICTCQRCKRVSLGIMDHQLLEILSERIIEEFPLSGDVPRTITPTISIGSSYTTSFANGYRDILAGARNIPLDSWGIPVNNNNTNSSDTTT